MYIYGQYEVNETAKSYLVVGDFSEDIEKITISKEEVEKLNVENVEPEKLAILMATIEANRFHNEASDTKILDEPEFGRSLRLGLSFVTIEEMIYEVEQMKYFEIKEYFDID